MSCGLPVVATNVGGIPEIVKNDYEFLCIPNEKDMSNKIITLINDRKVKI